MRLLFGVAFAALAALPFPLPLPTRDFVQDRAGMFSAAAVTRATERIAALRARTGNEILVVTVPSLPGAQTPGAVRDAAQQLLAQEGVNGVLVYIDRGDREDDLVSDQQGWFTPDSLTSIRAAMDSRFLSGGYDAGLRGVVGDLLRIYRSHAGGSPAGASAAPRFGLWGWLILGLAGYLVLRALLRRHGAGTPDWDEGGSPRDA